MREDGGRCPYNCRHGVVVAAGRAEETKQAQTPIAVAVWALVSVMVRQGLRPTSCSDSRTWMAAMEDDNCGV